MSAYEPTDANSSVEELRQRYSALNELDHDVQEIINLLNFTFRNHAIPSLCFDFDTLYTLSGKERSERSLDTFWTGLALNLPGFPCIALPGTLFEILKYFERREKKVAAVMQSPFGAAFHRFFENTSRSPDRQTGRLDKKQYSLAYEAFQDVNTTDSDLFLFHILQNKLGKIDTSIPNIDKELFLASVMQLSRGSRAYRLYNNRIDAYNYCTIEALNKKKPASRHYILISESSSVRSLDLLNYHRHVFNASRNPNSMSNDYDDPINIKTKLVWSPKRAAIFQLLGASANSVPSSIKHALIMAGEISQARAHTASILSAKLGDHQDLDTDEIYNRSTSEGTFLSIIEKLNGYKNRVNDILAGNEDLKSGKLFEKLDIPRDNPLDFVQNVQNYIKEILVSNGYQFSLDSYLPPPVAKMEVEPLEKDHRFKYQARARIAPHGSSFDDAACIYFRYPDYHLFVVNGVEQASEFISVFNVITQNLFKKMAMNEATNIPNNAKKMRHKFKLIAGDNNTFHEAVVSDFLEDLSIASISSKFRISAMEINFIRIDNALISASYEKTITAISSTYELTDEFAFFIQGLTKLPYRGTDFRQSVTSAINSYKPD